MDDLVLVDCTDWYTQAAVTGLSWGCWTSVDWHRTSLVILTWQY